ncbi:restriction endonuclease subunit S [Treponema rectale]|uniref:Restriction endonuclease subunit S n=1 Tax=Treponema rectale TaxID=744512 RepID=A0A840SDT9_9SPIR|nr:restriction endonuclease subunit S [Treponema rectale]MBB5219034.1 type I restriction enzyme S subunit [Treponema rectale]QOS41056.1 restriction endonuclease subunit S [Treponema rectale]
MKTEYIKFQNFIDSTQYGYTADETSFENGDCKYLRITDIVPYFVEKETVPFCKIPEEKKAQYMITDGDLLIARTGATTGYNLIVDDSFKNFIFASYLIRFNYDKKKLFPLYVKYVLKSKLWYGFVNNYISGSAQPGMNARVFGKFNFPYVPLPTQQKIASILSAYDNLIQNYKKQIEALQTAASELYKEWFVRFRFPGWQTTEFENGIPKGWKVERLSNYCKITDGTHDTPLQVEEGIPLVTGKAVKKGEIDFSIPYNISIEDHEKIKKRSGLKTGDILFSNIGTVGNSCLVEYDREFSVKNMIIFKPETIEKSMYLYYLITSDSCQQLFSAQTNGSTQQFLGLDFMRNFKILVPENSIISEFGKKQEVIYAKIRNLRKQITILTQQRNLLLPRLMSGKLEVK